MKKLSLLLLGFFAAFTLISCESQIKIEAAKDKLSINFDSVSKGGFEKLIKSFSSVNEGENASDFIQCDEIAQALRDSAFSDVKVSKENVCDLSIELSANPEDNLLLKSGLLYLQDGLFITDFSKEKLAAFYLESDSQIRDFLDLFMAPVFNDEEMSVDEYLETLAAFYGNDLASELKESRIKVFSKNDKNKIWSKSYSLAELLCGV